MSVVGWVGIDRGPSPCRSERVRRERLIHDPTVFRGSVAVVSDGRGDGFSVRGLMQWVGVLALICSFVGKRRGGGVSFDSRFRWI